MPPKKKSPGRPPYTTTDHDRQQVEQMAALGIRNEDIALVMGVHRNTISRHYKKELRRAATQANAVIAKTLFNMARTGKNTAATIFWLKCRANWREVDHDTERKNPTEIRIVGGLPD